MAYDPTYGNRLKALLSDPSSFSMSPDAQVGMQSGMNALTASNSAMRGSGNALSALVKYGNDSAQADYGNQISRLGTLDTAAQNYDLGQGQNANAATRNANDLALGTQSNANQRYATDSATGLGYFNDSANFILGSGQNANAAQANRNTAQNNAWNYDINQGQNANQAASTFANYDLGQGRNAIDWYNAGTNRGSAQSNAFNNAQGNALNWYKTMPKPPVYA